MLKSLHAGRVRQLLRRSPTCYRCMRTCVLCAAEWSTVTHAVTASAARLLPARAAPSLERLEAHLQAALLVPDTESGAPYSTSHCSNVQNTFTCILSSPHCHSCPPRHPQMGESSRPGLSVFRRGQLDITCGQRTAALRACLMSIVCCRQVAAPTSPMRPASAQQQRAANHSLEKQLLLGDCLAQHRRRHSYVQSLQCQSELQMSQVTDLHGHANLAAALQRAFCSEVKLEGIGLSCLVFLEWMSLA